MVSGDFLFFFSFSFLSGKKSGFAFVYILDRLFQFQMKRIFFPELFILYISIFANKIDIEREIYVVNIHINLLIFLKNIQIFGIMIILGFEILE